MTTLEGDDRTRGTNAWKNGSNEEEMRIDKMLIEKNVSRRKCLIEKLFIEKKKLYTHLTYGPVNVYGNLRCIFITVLDVTVQ